MSGSQRLLHNLRFLIVQASACGNLPQAGAFCLLRYNIFFHMYQKVLYMR